jgi:hypothetical protein
MRLVPRWGTPLANDARMLKLASLLVAVLALTSCAGSLPDDSRSIPFTTIEKTPIGGHTTPHEYVFETEAEYRAFYDQHPPATPTVDFTHEVVLAVTMGSQQSGGYSIEIVSINMPKGSTTAGVKVVQRAPKAGTPVTTGGTSPQHVVKVERIARDYVFTRTSS